MTDAPLQVWTAATNPSPRPRTVPVLLLGGVALVLAQVPLLRQSVTVVHEAGHAVVAVCVGRRVSGIRLHADASGLTLSRGRPRGPGMVATLLAGSPAPTVLGVGGAAVLVLAVRNVCGLLVLLVLGAGVAAAWLADAMGPDLLDAVVLTSGPVAYRRPDGIAVLPLALLGP